MRICSSNQSKTASTRTFAEALWTEALPNLMKFDLKKREGWWKNSKLLRTCGNTDITDSWKRVQELVQEWMQADWKLQSISMFINHKLSRCLTHLGNVHLPSCCSLSACMQSTVPYWYPVQQCSSRSRSLRSSAKGWGCAMSHFALAGIVKQKGGTVTSDNTQTHTVSTLWKMLAAVHHASKKTKSVES